MKEKEKMSCKGVKESKGMSKLAKEKKVMTAGKMKAKKDK